MKNRFDRVFLVAMAGIIAVLTGTALPVLVGESLGGAMLLLHVKAGGALVILLPVFAWIYLSRNLDHQRSGSLQRFGFWFLVVSGLLTIATIFLCMMPIPPTEVMHELILGHSYAGFAMVPAVLLLLIGAARWRRIQSTRSATPG